MRPALASFCTLLAACSSGIAADTPCQSPCADHETCVRATCVPLDCDSALCGDSEVCVENKCEAKTCVGVICAGDKICANGTCFPRPCGSVFCGDTEACVMGACVDARCVGITCDMGTVCANGRCLAPTCQGTVCDSGQVCVQNTCVDKSCVGVLCPGMQQCHGGQCANGCSALAPCSAGQSCVAAQCRPDAAALHFVTLPVTAVAGACSGALTLELVDATGARTAAAATTVLAMSGSLPGTAFFVDDACTVLAGALAFQPTDEVVTFYFRATQYGALDITASNDTLGMAKQTQTVTAPPKSVVVTSAPQVIAAGACSASLDVEVHDAAGQPATVGQPRVLDLSSDSPSLSWFSDGMCMTPVGQVVLAAGATGVHLYARDTHAGTATLQIHTPDLDPATQALTVNAGLPTRIGFDTPPREIEAGTCSLAVTVRAVDDFGNASGLAAPVDITPFAPSAAQLTFFTDRVCTTEIAAGKFTLTLPAGAAVATLYLHPLQAGATVLGVSAQGLGAGSQTQTVYPSAPVDVTFSTPEQTVGTGQCSSAFTVVVEDAYKNHRDWTQADQLTFQPSFGSTTLYTDASCMTALGASGTVGVSAGSFGVTVWARSTQPGNGAIYASSQLLSSQASQNLTFSNAAATKLDFPDASRAVKSQGCSDVIAINRLDTFGNPTSPGSPTQVTLSGATGVQFFASNDAACVTAITGVTITAGTSQAYLRVRAPSPGDFTLSASSPGIVTGTLPLHSFALPDRFSFTTAPQSITAGGCSTAVTVRSETASGVPLIPNLDAHVGVSAYYLSTYADSACGVPLPNGEVLITSDGGTASGTYYLSYPFSGPLTVYANANFNAPMTGEYLGNATGAQAESITAGAATQLQYTSAPGGSTAGACTGAWVVEVRDQYGNVVTGAAPRTVSLGSNPASGLDFFAGPTCSGSPLTTPIQVTGPAGGSTATFSIRATSAGTKTIAANSAGVTGASGQTQVFPGPVQGISFTTGPQVVSVNMCAPSVITVTSVDQYGNASDVPSDLQVTLAATAGAAGFFRDTSCSDAITPGNPAIIGVGSSATSFHVKPSSSGTLTIQATALGYTPVTQNETVP